MFRAASVAVGGGRKCLLRCAPGPTGAGACAQRMSAIMATEAAQAQRVLSPSDVCELAVVAHRDQKGGPCCPSAPQWLPPAFMDCVLVDLLLLGRSRSLPPVI